MACRPVGRRPLSGTDKSQWSCGKPVHVEGGGSLRRKPGSKRQKFNSHRCKGRTTLQQLPNIVKVSFPTSNRRLNWPKSREWSSLGRTLEANRSCLARINGMGDQPRKFWDGSTDRFWTKKCSIMSLVRLQKAQCPRVWHITKTLKRDIEPHILSTGWAWSMIPYPFCWFFHQYYMWLVVIISASLIVLKVSFNK